VRLMGGVLCCAVVLLPRREARYSATDGWCGVVCCAVVLLPRREARYSATDGWCAVLCCVVLLEGGKVQCD
jgi:hypothetical protein